MINKYILSVLILAASSAVMGTVMADDQSPGEGAMTLQDMDTDGDGSLTPEEASSSDEIMSNWNELDTDQDGMMSESEFSSFQESQSSEGNASSIPGDTTNPGSDIE